MRATLKDTAVSAEGVPLLEGLTLTFHTIGDLSVSQTSPADSVDEVAADSSITVIFNRPVVPLTIAETAADWPDILAFSPPVSGSGEWLNTSVYIFRPDQPLIGRQTYTARVLADAVNNLSVNGAQLAADYEWSFAVTAPTIEYLNLPGETSSPRNNFRELRLDQTFQLIFSTPMDPDSTETAVTLTPDNGTPLPLNFGWNDTFTTLTITPTYRLALQNHYTLLVTDAAQSASGGQLRHGLQWTATTVPAPAIIYTIPANGATTPDSPSSFEIHFASTMDWNSLKGKVIFSPEINGNPDGFYSSWDRSLYFYGFQPSTTYTVQILPGMADPYGNTINEGQTVTFTTGPYTPSAGFNMPWGPALYRPGGSTAVWTHYRNTGQLTVELYRIDLSQFGRLTRHDLDANNFSPGEVNLIWRQRRAVSSELNASGYEQFDLLFADGGPLEPGFYYLTLNAQGVRKYGRFLETRPVIVTNANVTLKTTATEAMIWVTDLQTGEPVSGAPVTLYNKFFAPVFTGTTDGDGLIYRDGLSLDVDWDAVYYAVTGSDDWFGAAISNWNDGVRPWDFGINTDFYLQPNQPTTYVTTDRPLYRPGQPVYFKGIVRLNDDLTYSLPGYGQVDVTIASFDEVVYEETLPLSSFGSFTGQFTLADEATLGGYQISITQNDEWLGGGYFDVAEYR
ncbi:MAG: Ig-like domain-containing protein, partial [Anaerolineae bacterium]